MDLRNGEFVAFDDHLRHDPGLLSGAAPGHRPHFARHGGKVKPAAQELGISERTIYRKLAEKKKNQ